jgi:hypothetical protein
VLGYHDRIKHQDWMRRDNGTGPTIGNVLELSESPLDQTLVLAASKCDLEGLRDALLKGAHGMD